MHPVPDEEMPAPPPAEVGAGGPAWPSGRGEWGGDLVESGV